MFAIDEITGKCGFLIAKGVWFAMIVGFSNGVSGDTSGLCLLVERGAVQYLCLSRSLIKLHFGNSSSQAILFLTFAVMILSLFDV